MKRVFVSITVISLVFLSACFFPGDLNAQETRDLDPFTGIGMGISADVYYTPGNSHEIRIEGNSRDVKDLITKVEDGYLKLKYKDRRVKWSKLTVYITSKELDRVGLSGSGDFKSDKPVSSEEMSIAISGSGNVLFAVLNTEELEVKISGSGSVYYHGAPQVNSSTSGSGKVKSF